MTGRVAVTGSHRQSVLDPCRFACHPVFYWVLTKSPPSGLQTPGLEKPRKQALEATSLIFPNEINDWHGIRQTLPVTAASATPQSGRLYAISAKK